MDVLGHRRRRERKRQYLYVGRNLQGQRHRPVLILHLAIPASAACEERRRLRRALALEDARRSSLIPFATSNYAFPMRSLRDVADGSHTHKLELPEIRGLCRPRDG